MSRQYVVDGAKPALRRYLPRSLRALGRRLLEIPRRRRIAAMARVERADYRGFFRRAFHMLDGNGIGGDYVEFGCYSATTFCIAYHAYRQGLQDAGPCHLWAFDSFAGLPSTSLPEDEHPHWTEGVMAMSLEKFHRLCRKRGVPREAYTAVPGFYSQTLDPAAEGPRPEKIRLAYVDCDLYSSAKSVLEFLLPRLQHGMVLAFDDYFCYSSHGPSGERLAALETFAGHPQWQLVPYLSIGWNGMSFIVEKRKVTDTDLTACL